MVGGRRTSVLLIGDGRRVHGELGELKGALGDWKKCTGIGAASKVLFRKLNEWRGKRK